MAELTEVIKISKPVKNDLEEIREKGRHSSFDSVVRMIIEINKRLEAENKLLKNDLQICKKENLDLKTKINTLIKNTKEI